MDEEQFLKIGHIIYIQDPIEKFFAIAGREPFDFETGEEDTLLYSEVASGAESGFIEIENLEPDENPLHLFEVLWGVNHTNNVKYYIKYPSGVSRLGTDDDKDIGFINSDKSPGVDPDPSYKFYTYPDHYPSINCENHSAVIITPKIYFKGMKYQIDEIKDTVTLQKLTSGAIPFRRIVLGGLRTS